MKKAKLSLDALTLPPSLIKMCEGVPLFDSSCSPEARVIYVERDGGYFIKSAPLGTLKNEALLDEYFYRKGLSSAVVDYFSFDGRDYLVTERIRGEDATHSLYLSEPSRLATLMGEMLRTLHETDFSDCPVKDRMKNYFHTVRENYKSCAYDLSFGNFKNADEAYRIAIEGEKILKNDTLIHGDFCLPNFLLDNWQFSGYIDLGNGGVGDRHVDLFWGAWTLNFNLKTDAYRDRFFDAYGRDKIDKDALLAVSAAEVFG